MTTLDRLAYLNSHAPYVPRQLQKLPPFHIRFRRALFFIARQLTPGGWLFLGACFLVIAAGAYLGFEN